MVRPSNIFDVLRVPRYLRADGQQIGVGRESHDGGHDEDQPGAGQHQHHFENVSLGTREGAVKSAATPPIPASPSESVCLRNSNRPEFASIVSLIGGEGGGAASFMDGSERPAGAAREAFPQPHVLEDEHAADRPLGRLDLIALVGLPREIEQKLEQSVDDPMDRWGPVDGHGEIPEAEHIKVDCLETFLEDGLCLRRTSSRNLGRCCRADSERLSRS